MPTDPPAPDETLDEVWRRHGKEMPEAAFRDRIAQLRDERASWAEREHAKQRKRADKAQKSKSAS